MANNRVQNGKRVDITLAAAATAGVPFSANDMLVVPMVSGEIGDVVACAVSEVYRIAKLTTGVFAIGDKLNWDDSASELTVVATAAAGDVTGCGIAWEAAGNGTTDVAVLLTPNVGVGS